MIKINHDKESEESGGKKKTFLDEDDHSRSHHQQKQFSNEGKFKAKKDQKRTKSEKGIFIFYDTKIRILSVMSTFFFLFFFLLIWYKIWMKGSLLRVFLYLYFIIKGMLYRSRWLFELLNKDCGVTIKYFLELKMS